MRYAKEIKALAKKVAAGELAYMKQLWKDDKPEMEREGISQRVYMDLNVDKVESVLADEVIGNLTDAAIKEYRKLVREQFARKK